MLFKILAFVGAALYGGAFLCAERKQKKAETALWLGGVLISAVLVFRNFLANGYVPFVSMYQVLTFLSLTFFPIYLLIRFLMDGAWLDKYFQLPAALVLTGVGFMDSTAHWTFPPALQSVWFVPHVLVYMIGYSLVAVAAAVMTVSFFTADGLSKEQMREGCQSLARVAFPFMTAGMLLGALWANQVWGNYWSWDMKENWALVTWLFLTLYLHFYPDRTLRKVTPLLLLLTFIGVVITMLFVNVFNSGGSLHAYSM